MRKRDEFAVYKKVFVVRIKICISFLSSASALDEDNLVSCVARKQEFDQRNCYFKESLLFLRILFDENYIVKLVVYNALWNRTLSM